MLAPLVSSQQANPVTHQEIAVTSPPPGPLLSVRAALVILLAALVSTATGGLTFLTSQSIPTAILAGGAAAGGALLCFNQLIGQ